MSTSDDLSFFAELIPLSPIAHSTTLLPSNLRYIKLKNQASKDGRRKPNIRLVRLSFAAIAGRHCFSFGKSQSSDYILSASDAVAPHHFILFFDIHNKCLHLRATCPEGVYISSESAGDFHVAAPNDTTKILASSTIRIGEDDSVKFKILRPTANNEYNASVLSYLATIHQPTPPSLTPKFTDPSLTNKGKKRKASVGCKEASIQKRRRDDSPSSAVDRVVLHETQTLSNNHRQTASWFGGVARRFAFVWGS